MGGRRGASEGPGLLREAVEGVITQAKLRRLHKKFDLNGDGKASHDELHKYFSRVRKEIAYKETADIMKDYPEIADGELTMDEHWEGFEPRSGDHPDETK